MLARVGPFAVGMTVAIATALGVAPVAAADHDDTMRCDFTMTGPAVVDVNGTAMVMATLKPATCTGPAAPNSSQACLSAPGSAGRCTELHGYMSATVYLSPYVPGTTYTARGRGCAVIGNPPQANCTTVGPRSVTL